MAQDQRAKPAWVTYLDIYGFRAAVKDAERRNDSSTVYQRLESAHRQAVKTISEARMPAYFRLSDNIFYIHDKVVLKNPQAEFDRCLNDIRATIDAYLKFDLPVRGGVAYGEITYGPNLLVGDAVSRAVEYEKLANAPLVIVPEHELILGGVAPFVRAPVDVPIYQFDSVGLLSALPIVPRNVQKFRAYAAGKYGVHRKSGPPKTAWAWRQVVSIIDDLSAPNVSRNERAVRNGRIKDKQDIV